MVLFPLKSLTKPVPLNEKSQTKQGEEASGSWSMKAGEKESCISVYELTKSQVHPKESRQNTPKEAKILITTDMSQCSGPALILNGACEE